MLVFLWSTHVLQCIGFGLSGFIADLRTGFGDIECIVIIYYG